ncbi:MAG TPA: hypothetical protein VGT61_02830 [Thermomicrobiales bacterium]|jgi:hypothetical protein|nr:hypothetical protein [Thermomicrobiales bacterium]
MSTPHRHVRARRGAPAPRPRYLPRRRSSVPSRGSTSLSHTGTPFLSTAGSGAVTVGARPVLAETGTGPASPTAWRRVVGLVERHWPFLLVLCAFIASWAIVPIFTATPVGDDWVYSLSVEYLLDEGRLEILDLSVTTLVFQVLWGSLFGFIFGNGFGTQRLSTVVLFALSGIAFYSLLRTLGISYGRSALGVAVYLFNPLSFVLAFSFMTDPHYVATMVISIAFYAAGLRMDRPSRKLILAGAFFAGCAFLVRQQGALIPLAIGGWLLLTGQLWFNRRSLVRLLEVAAIPAVMLALYYLWLWFIHGVPEQQDQFLNQIQSAGIGGTWLLLRRVTYFETVIVGLFVLPITLAAIAGLGSIVRDLIGRWRGRGQGRGRARKQAIGSGIRWAAMAGWLVIVILGAIVTVNDDYLMPYISQYVGTSGLGPNDLFGGRPPLFPEPEMTNARLWLTWVCVGSAIVFGATTIAKVGSIATPERAIAAMLLFVGLGQVAGVMPPSFHFRDWAISLDRYLLPLLPFTVALLLWSLRGRRMMLPVGWIAVGLFAAVSIAGTRDFLTFQKATWDYARYANYDLGIPLTQLNGGSSWDGYFLHEYGEQYDIPQQSVGGPWWSNLFATATDSTYAISGSPTAPDDGTYVVIGQREYSSWLQSEPVYLYLMQRQRLPAGAAPPPSAPEGTPPPPIFAHPVS